MEEQQGGPETKFRQNVWRIWA